MTSLEFNENPTDPVELLTHWLEEARTGTDLPNPNAMTLATVDEDGRPSARIVLLRGLDDRGAVFFTHYRGRKGRELEGNRHAALVFHWDGLERQVRIEGAVTRASEEESDAYWATRPRDSRLGAWASRQSEVIPDRSALQSELDRFDKEFEGRDVPRPDHWGGFRVALERVEFWQGQPARIHDRLLYHRTADGWRTERLSP